MKAEGTFVATLREFFELSPFFQFFRTISLQMDNLETVDVYCAVVQDVEGGSKYLKIYIPSTSSADMIVYYIIDKIDELVWKPASDVVFAMGFKGTEKISNLDLRFSGRVIVYTPSIAPTQRWSNLAEQISKKGFSLIVRD